jgi:hypothetical protein
MTAPAHAGVRRRVVSIGDGGSCRCDSCDGALDFSYLVLFSDGHRAHLCSVCLPS